MLYSSTNTIELDRDTIWFAGEPVYWRSPTPIVGIQPNRAAAHHRHSARATCRPPTEPPIDGEMVQLTLNLELPVSE